MGVVRCLGRSTTHIISFVPSVPRCDHGLGDGPGGDGMLQGTGSQRGPVSEGLGTQDACDSDFVESTAIASSILLSGTVAAVPELRVFTGEADHTT